jgi:predicted NAD/FAD-binding protein
MHYEHPIYTAGAVRAQARLGGLATDRTVYAGAYHGWGFHEDGCRSGVAAARHFGATW